MRKPTADTLALLKAAPKGLLIAELWEATGSKQNAIGYRLDALREAGLAKWVLDPGFKAGFRCRWFATEHAPRGASDKNPGDARTQQRESLKIHRAIGGKSKLVLDKDAPANAAGAKVIVCPASHDHRHTFIGTPGRHVDASECRPRAAPPVGAR